MFSLLFERRQRVMLVRLSGRLTRQDVGEAVRSVRELAVAQGPVGGIVDCTGVDVVDVASQVIVGLGAMPPAMESGRRVFVLPGAELYGLGRMYVAHQEQAGSPGPLLVRTLEDAYRALDLVEANFEPV